LTTAKYYKLVAASLVIGVISGLLAITLKRITEHYEHILFSKAESNNFYFALFPIVGLSLIYILRHYVFKKKENKGIKEVFESTEKGTKLPAYKIPSHFING